MCCLYFHTLDSRPKPQSLFVILSLSSTGGILVRRSLRHSPPVQCRPPFPSLCNPSSRCLPGPPPAYRDPGIRALRAAPLHNTSGSCWSGALVEEGSPLYLREADDHHFKRGDSLTPYCLESLMRGYARRKPRPAKGLPIPLGACFYGTALIPESGG